MSPTANRDAPTIAVSCDWLRVPAHGFDLPASWLNDSERERAAAMDSPARRTGFVLGRALLRRLVCRQLDAAPGGIEFGREQKGRLRLRSSAGSLLGVSVSHTSGFVAAACSAQGELGIDLEKVRPVRGAAAIAERRFTRQERADLGAMEEHPRLVHFLRLFTLKESHLKATGQGLSGALGAPGFARGRDDSWLALDPEGGPAAGARDWQYHTLDLGNECVGALTARGGKPLELDLREVELGALAPDQSSIE